MKKPNKWGRRTYTPEQWLKRDMRSAATRADKAHRAGRKPISLAPVKALDDEASGERNG